MSNTPWQQPPPMSPTSPRTRAQFYHSEPIPQSPSQAQFPQNTIPSTPRGTNGSFDDNNNNNKNNNNGSNIATDRLQSFAQQQQPPSPKPSRSSTGGLPTSPGGGTFNLHLASNNGNAETNNNIGVRQITTTTTTTAVVVAAATADRAPQLQFNTSEIQRSYQALLKKQPLSTGQSVLQTRPPRNPPPKDNKPRQFLSPSSQLNNQSKQQLPRSPSRSGRSNSSGGGSSGGGGGSVSRTNSISNQSINTLSTSLSHSPIFGSPASEHARHWIRSVGRDHQPSDSESEQQRESDPESYEDNNQQQQWQIDYEHDVAGQVELETAVETDNVRKHQGSATWATRMHPLIMADLQRSNEQEVHPGPTTPVLSPTVRVKDHAIHPLSPVLPSPSSGTSTPRIPQSRSPEIRPQTILYPGDLAHGFDIGSTVNHPLPPLPPPPTTLPEKPRMRTKHRNVEPPKRAPNSNPVIASKLAPTPPTVTENQPVSLTNPPRKCIHHGKILQVINTSTVKDRYLFLFSDILLIAKHMSEGHPTLDSRFQVKDVIELKKISLSLTRDKYDPKSGEAGGLGNRKIPPILAEFIHTFDQNPTRALNTFIQKRALHPDPVSVAHLLFKTPELSKTQLALFLSNTANKHVYRAFLDQCQFAGVLLDEALRTLLGRLSIPDRLGAPLQHGVHSDRTINSVDYVLEEFTKRWYEANVNVVVFDASIAHKLVIAMIVLNAQLHDNEGASIVKDREEVGILVRPRVASQPSTPTISSTPVMEPNLLMPSIPSMQQYMVMDLDDLTAFPMPTRESFVEMFQLLDQQRIVPRDMLYSIFSSISHQPLDIDSDKLDVLENHADSTPAVARKLWPVMVSPAVLPPRMTLKIPSDPITITIPVLNPHFSILLYGRDLKCEPSILEFGSHRSQRFRVTGSAPGKKTLTIHPKLVAEKGAPEQYYDLQALPSKHTIAIERQFMRHTFQISLLNDLGTRRRYLFGTSTGVEKDEWARVLTDCLLMAKGQNAVRLNEHTSLEQSIGLQILKELLLGVETSDEDEVVPSQVNGQPEPVPLPIPVATPPAMGLGIPTDGHTLPGKGPAPSRSAVSPSVSTFAAAASAGHQSPTLGVSANIDWHNNTGSISPKDQWLCRMPKPGSAIPDRHGWELIRLVEQNSLMALMLGFMGALGRDRLRRMEAIRRSVEEEARLAEEEEEEYEEYEEDEGYGLEEEEEYEYEEEYYEQSTDIETGEDEQRYSRVGLEVQEEEEEEEEEQRQQLEVNVEHVHDTIPARESVSRDTAATGEEEGESGSGDSDDAVMSAVSGRVRKVKGKEIWWTQ
ncbi:hypothetical protein EDD21DRAFT_368101 [Dissophora ornata]|nr:hypothetical protein EDD21DRAFT_368101 [Dissophora ornata]